MNAYARLFSLYSLGSDLNWRMIPTQSGSSHCNESNWFTPLQVCPECLLT